MNLINYISSLSFTDILFFTVLMVLIILIIVLIHSFRNNPYLDILRNQTLMNNEKENDNVEKEDNIDLVSLTKSLEEAANKERNIDLTPYEEEQEEKAIISYDELVKAKNDLMINYEDEKEDDGIVIKKVNLDNLTKIVEHDDEKIESTPRVTISYEKEEAFLEALKQLQQMLNS